MTREEILTSILDLADKLGHTPSRSELAKMSDVTRRLIRTHFGTYTRALRECKLEGSGGGRKLSVETLFRDWASLVRKLKKIPTTLEYEQFSQYSIGPLTTRFKGWGQVPRSFLQHAHQSGWAEDWADVLEIIATHERGRAEPGKMGDMMAERPAPKIFIDRPLYGPAMTREPLAHGPINEQGVIFLFGARAEQLGFIVTRMQSGFPDCEAMRDLGNDRCQRVQIEIEHESRNFLKHGHPTNGCDLIVCWEHNWPECPLEVVELKRAVSHQPSAASSKKPEPHD